MRQIRNKVFETNSSSVHTISISKDGMEPSYLPLNKDGKVIGRFDCFGSEHYYYNRQDEKLSYLLTQCAYLWRNSSDEWFDDINEISEEGKKEFHDYGYVRLIEAALMDYIPECKGLIVDFEIEPEIDHRSVPYLGDDLICDIWDRDKIQEFIFNKYVSLETDCD